MATRTIEHSSFGPSTYVELDLNDANWRVSRVRAVNGSQVHSLAAEVFRAGSLVVDVLVGPGETLERAVTGIQLGWQPDYWNSITEQWEPDGIDMGDYEVRARFPA